MSNQFGGVTVLPYQGVSFRLPVKLPQGVSVPPNQVPPSVCPVTINWANYFTALGGNPIALGVYVNLQAASVQASILDRIASCKIDNTGSPCPVYVVFGDTNDVISCAEYSSVTFPCLTNLLQATIYVAGLNVNQLPTTRVFFYNSDMPPVVDNEIGSSVALFRQTATQTLGNTIQQTQNFGPAALGDQLASAIVTLTGLTGTQILPPVAGFYYITGIYAFTVGASTGVAGSQGGEVVLEQNGGALTVIDFNFLVTQNAPPGIAEVFNMQNMQLKISGLGGYVIENSQIIPQGFLKCYINYTINPT